jgi:hypothetical protein
MSVSTRGRIITVAGFLAASTLLGTALAAGPVMEHDGHAAMQQESTPRMQQEGTLAALRKVRPAPWDEAAPAPWEI